tara:strand:+ start:16 stop:267 length:252 start_codon:yes stop_codon:yes gene_type:complete
MAHIKTYATINISDIGLIDFSQIDQTSANTVRKNIAETEFIIKWEEGNALTFITDGSVVPLQTLTLSEILALVETPEWSSPII